MRNPMKKNREAKIIFAVIAVLFAVFLAGPVLRLLGKSVVGPAGLTTGFYAEVLGGRGFLRALGNSFLVASVSAAVTTAAAFVIAYTINYTNVPGPAKKIMRQIALLPMLLPTITYGFAIIYSFGKQGLLTRLFGRQFVEIYGFGGLLTGYVIYTLPISFMLIYNTMCYIDKKYMVVSRIMGDSPFTTFTATVLRPLSGTFAASFIQAFFLSFTDFGIPAAVGGEFEVVASVLYSQMLGSVPNFNNGAVVAMVMLVPSVVSIAVLQYLERYNVRYNKISTVEIRRGPARDLCFGLASLVICVCVLSIFAVIFVIPFVEAWPYNLKPSLDNFRSVLGDSSLAAVYKNSLLVAVLTAALGTLIAYGAALITARSTVRQGIKNGIEAIALITNTIPGMVLGLAFLFSFSGTPLQNTFFLIIICNVVHFFSTPYLMMKNSLAKMNASWENTAMLMGDSWLKTIVRVVTPNAMSTVMEVFSYYFINAMVTISAVIFIAGARTMVITTKIKELQYYNKYNEIFVLSLFILLTNCAAKYAFGRLAERSREKINGGNKKMRVSKRMRAAGLAGLLAAVCVMVSGCSGGEKQVVIYSNADDEAVTAMKNALDNNGYKDKYIFQNFGTSELGGKLLAEGTDIEADLVTMSTFYVESAQEQNDMFLDLTFDPHALAEYPSYCTPITAQEGAIILNTQMMADNNLPAPASIKDLADPVYAGMVSVTDVTSSSTAWLLIQALISEYGEDGAKEVLSGIYENAGPHIEESGTGPLKKCRAGEVAVGFGLRHQAVADKAEGLPIDYVDPAEGNFTLTESVAVIDKGNKTNPLAMEMAQCIIENGRSELLESYPVPLYEGEAADEANRSGNPKTFAEKLTVELLEKHQELSESCKPQ